MNSKNSRRGACDRCRGQKLACSFRSPANVTRLSNPVFISDSRFQRNDIPCERCARAKVECYSVRPARRTVVSDRTRNKRAIGTRSYPVRPSPVTQQDNYLVISPSASTKAVAELTPHPNVQPLNPARESNMANAYSAESNRQTRETHTSSTMSTTSSEWVPYAQNDDIGWNDSDLNFCQDPMMDSLGDHNTIELTDKTSSVDWNPQLFDIEASLNQTEFTRHTLSNPRNQSDPDYRTNSSGKIQRPLHGSSAQKPDLATPCTTELARLNEMLLSAKNSLEDTSTQRDCESGQLSIGQTLHHSQDFISILRRLKSSHSNHNSDQSLTLKRLSLGQHNNSEGASLQSSSAVGYRSCSGSSSFSPRINSSPPAPTPAVVLPLEIPTSLLMLSCYASILQLFEQLFTPILQAVTRPMPIVPVILTGLRLGGFPLDDHHVLQLECLIHVSLSLLDTIERILVGYPTGQGLLGGKMFASLIDALYEQNGFEDGGGKREVRVKRLIHEIKAALKVIDI